MQVILEMTNASTKRRVSLGLVRPRPFGFVDSPLSKSRRSTECRAPALKTGGFLHRLCHEAISSSSECEVTTGVSTAAPPPMQSPAPPGESWFMAVVVTRPTSPEVCLAS